MDKICINEAVNELRTLRDVLRWATSCFSGSGIWYGHGTDNPWDESLQLILPLLGLPADTPADMYDARLTSTERQHVLAFVQQRIEQRTPVSYLINKAWFCGLEFYVDERVLIPRSPIGELINQQFNGLIASAPTAILDMCTGSGCIAIACAYAFPDAEVDAVDISEQALEVAEYNITSHGLTHQVTPMLSDLFNDLSPVQYDLIVTNPPYVDAEDMDDLPEEYRHEPELGLAAGDDGLQLVRDILFHAPDFLSENGVLICEVGNSMVHLQAQYPEIPFRWLSFERGGEGVFMLTRQQIVAVRHHFTPDSH